MFAPTLDTPHFLPPIIVSKSSRYFFMLVVCALIFALEEVCAGFGEEVLLR